MWIARDKAGRLGVYSVKPIRKTTIFEADEIHKASMSLFETEFPEITWENSPKEIRTLLNTSVDSNVESIRQLFAIEALNGLLASGNPDDGTYVNQAVGYADLLINKLNNETL